MAQRSCCVSGCAMKLGGGLPLHRFPNPNNPAEIERFRTWIMKIGGDIIGENNQFIHRNRKVCHRHFKEIYTFPNKKLTSLAIPSLHIPSSSNVAPTPAGDPAVDDQTSSALVATTEHTPLNTKIDTITETVTCETASAATTKASATIFKEFSLSPSEKNDDSLQFHKETQVVSDIEDTIEAVDEGPFSWQKSVVVPCDKEEFVGSEPTSQLIDDDVLLYDSKPHHSQATQDTFTEKINEVLEELKCNLCENIIKTGFRYSCVQCPDFDLCGACEAKGAHRMHYVLRSPCTKDISEVQLMLRLIRQAILADSIVSLRDHPDAPKDEIKEEVEEGPEPEREEDDPLSADFHLAKTTAQELTVDECLDTTATESEEDEPLQKIPALSPFESLEMPTTFTLVTTQGSSAKENQVLVQIKPHKSTNIRKTYIHVPDETKQSHIKTPRRPIVLKRTPKEKSFRLIRSTQQGHSSENPVSTQTFAEKRVLLPITQSNLIVKNSSTSITPSNIIVQDNRTPMTPGNIIVQDNTAAITPSQVIVQDSRTPITRSNITVQDNRISIAPSCIIVQDNRMPITPRHVVVPKSAQSVVIETKSERLQTMTLNPTVRIERLGVHTFNYYKSGRQTYR
ncbi:uncharacterized protein LOC113228195 isoform X2 [Hyposmocoma kahamanoa]|uniref:uncharacterized protein LOC113228195 isoform X2 n=1 Tax=Hyposmocoma kahamanoa TaxID=1477025 RepID=UPI000E6D8FA1|nr:uncharacterized protein LOC113228195 isoform X2 [Hyposmocoma kahamanoa]